MKHPLLFTYRYLVSFKAKIVFWSFKQHKPQNMMLHLTSRGREVCFWIDKMFPALNWWTQRRGIYYTSYIYNALYFI